jgi:hypothetical protein
MWFGSLQKKRSLQTEGIVAPSTEQKKEETQL